MIEQAQAEWLRARERWLRCPDEESSAAYWQADRLLLAAFADGWSADMWTISFAYRAFRALLAQQCQPEPLAYTIGATPEFPAV